VTIRPQVDATPASEAGCAALPEPSCEVTHVGRVFRVERHRVATRAGGEPLVKDVVRHPGAVTVVAIRDDGMLVLVRNQRFAVAERLLEFCAGKLEPGEDPADAARRELEEETGYAAGRIEPLGIFYTSPGFTDERMHVYLATALTPVPQRLEPGEDLEVAVLSPEELRTLISRGQVADGKTLGAYLLWRLRSSR
jgi:ADP-ribose pyrophosphatase